MIPGQRPSPSPRLQGAISHLFPSSPFLPLIFIVQSYYVPCFTRGKLFEAIHLPPTWVLGSSWAN